MTLIILFHYLGSEIGGLAVRVKQGNAASLRQSFSRSQKRPPSLIFIPFGEEQFYGGFSPNFLAAQSGGNDA
jgi:hypothetical protein